MKILVKVDPSPREQPNQNKRGENENIVLLSLFIRDNRNLSRQRPHRLKRYSIFITKSIEVIDPEAPEKYNNTKMTSGRLFTVATQHNTRCCDIKIRFVESNQTKIKS